MKLLFTIAKVAVALTVVVGFTGCGSKKNGSAASTPGSSCTWNGYQYVTSGGAPCNPSGTSTQICPQSGQIYNQMTGQWMYCTPGQQVNVGGWPSPDGYPLPPYPNQQTSGCAQYLYQYGVPYVPIFHHQYQQYICVRYDLVQGYDYNSNYGNYGYNYYYAYPPRSGSGCGTQIGLGGQLGYLNICF